VPGHTKGFLQYVLCIERRENPINYQSDRINKQISSLPDILIKLKMEINAVLEIHRQWNKFQPSDLLSPYLFILVLKLLSAAIKNDPEITGVKINDSEFLLCQYADDSSLILDDNPKSLDQSLFMFNKFSECARLRINLDKTEAICLGSRRICHEQLLPDKHLSWNFSAKFKLLGITFNLSESDKTLGNFTEKVQSVKNILNLWSYRDLTYIGKVTVIKTLALPILVQCLTVLPNPPDSALNDIEEIFLTNLWNGKKDKIKRSVIINEYEEGGLKMPHIQSFYKALKMS
jgi:hypothetical protein